MTKSNEISLWNLEAIPSQKGRHVIITGGNSGIGWQAALALARSGAAVTLPARTREKSEDAAGRIRTEVPEADVTTGVIDLSSMHSVRAFAAEQAAEGRQIDVLINNAGVMAIPTKTLSVDGNEMQFATNVLGHFLLTGLLLPQILQAPSPRIITVSSSAHEMSGPLQIDNLNSEKKYSAFKAYTQTKLMNLLVAGELQRRLGSRLLSVSCHPGAAQTNLFSHPQPLLFKLMIKAFWRLAKPADRAARPLIFSATSPFAEAGAYYGPENNYGKSGAVKEGKMAKQALDVEAATQLFRRLEALSNVRIQAQKG